MFIRKCQEVIIKYVLLILNQWFISSMKIYYHWPYELEFGLVSRSISVSLELLPGLISHNLCFEQK